MVGGSRLFTAHRESREAMLREQCTVIRREARGTGDDEGGWVMCHVMQREVIMSLVLVFLNPPPPDISMLSVPSAALIVLHPQYPMTN